MLDFGFLKLNRSSNDKRPPATVIPIAGGKGGVGKSIIAANLAIALAQRGHNTVAIDLDLGGSNLHSYLGLPNSFSSIGEFLFSKGAQLEDYLVQTQWEGLKFIPGDGRVPFLANINHANKAKLLKRIQAIEADYVLLDLGAGSGFNTLDFFSIVRHGLLVSTPEQPALMGMMGFCKNLILREIQRALSGTKAGLELFHKQLVQPDAEQRFTIADFLSEFDKLDPQGAESIHSLTTFFQPRLILNMGTHPNELADKLDNAADALEKVLSMRTEHFGFVFADEQVVDSVQEGVSLMEYAPDSLAAIGIRNLAERVSTIWNTEIEDSPAKLFNHTQDVYRTITANQH